jgi:tRNA dimethylallyltransferase
MAITRLSEEPAYNLIVVLGPTATGKTRFASELAAVTGAEIISADSRQIYRRMDLGTGKDYHDYRAGGRTIPYHLIDIHEPGYKYNVYEYQKDFIKAYLDIRSRNKIAILCGGTGLYIDSVTRAYKLITVPENQALRRSLTDKTLPELEKILASYRPLHNKTDTDIVKRAIRAIEIEEYYKNNPGIQNELPDIHPVFLGLHCDRTLRRERITARLMKRLEEGMIEEVRKLLDEGIPTADLIYYGLEYKYITLYLTKQLDHDTMVQKLNTAIHQFAKRQMTWFRKMEREGVEIHWIDSEFSMKEKLDVALGYL